MLVNCPKCGFSQPQDKYCAKCGVDIENFQPQTLSLFSRILLHPALHVITVLVLVVIAVSYIKTKNREKQSFLAQVERMQNGPVIIEKTEPSASPTETSGTVALAASAETLPETGATTAPPAGAEASASSAKMGLMAASNATPEAPEATAPAEATTTTGTAAPNSKGGKASLKAGHRLNMIFAEVDTTTLDRWVRRMQSSGQYSAGDFRMGALPNIEKEIASDRSIVVMDQVEKFFENGSSQEWFVGKTSRDQGMGFKTTMTLSSADREALHGEVKMTRTLEATDPRNFEAEFELAPQAGWVFSDLLSRQYRLDPEDELNPKSFFQIFNSPRFKNLRTQFAVLFVFDKAERPPSK